MSAMTTASSVSAASPVRVSGASRRSTAVSPLSAPRVLSSPVLRKSKALGSRLVARAETKDVDFDGLLSNIADKFEKADNKAAIIGWSAAGLGAFFFTEWLIHLPGLNLLLGFPIQTIGVLSLPVLYTRYISEGKDVVEDIGDATKKVTKQLPGLDK